MPDLALATPQDPAMPYHPKRVPSYRLHKSSGQAVVTINGRDHYLGRHGSPESHTAYRRQLARWFERRETSDPGDTATVAEVVDRYLAYIRRHHRGRAHGKTAIAKNERALGVLTGLFAHRPAEQFGPKALKDVRSGMVRLKWSRGYVNECVGVVKRCWRWAVSEELVPPTTLHALEAVEGLAYGAQGVRESEPRMDVAWENVRRSLRHLSPMSRAIVLTLWYTGARPSEVLAMRVGEVNCSTDPWVFRPADHKCRWRGQGREILIGPKCQRVLRRYLAGESGAWMWPSPSRSGHFTADGLRAVITRACLMAGAPHWCPYMLRHAFAERVSQQSSEAARILMGHRSLQMTMRYTHGGFSDPLTFIVRNVG